MKREPCQRHSLIKHVKDVGTLEQDNVTDLLIQNHVIQHRFTNISARLLDCYGSGGHLGYERMACTGYRLPGPKCTVA